MKRKKNSTVSLTGSQSYFMCMKKTSLYHYFFWSKMENKDKPCFKMFQENIEKHFLKI